MSKLSLHDKFILAKDEFVDLAKENDLIDSDHRFLIVDCVQRALKEVDLENFYLPYWNRIKSAFIFNGPPNHYAVWLEIFDHMIKYAKFSAFL